MYIPSSFSETDPATLLDFIERHNFGLLISQQGKEPLATHLPLQVDRQAGPSGSLVGHMARANRQWQSVKGSVLVVFTGPHAYISPSWYESGKAVPTWNYVAAHVYGTFHVIEEPEAVLKILHDLVALHEHAMPEPWSFQDDDEYVGQLVRSIMAFRVEIIRIEGKWKLSQNHSRRRRENVIDALAQRGDENSQAIAAMMARTLVGCD